MIRILLAIALIIISTRCNSRIIYSYVIDQSKTKSRKVVDVLVQFFIFTVTIIASVSIIAEELS